MNISPFQSFNSPSRTAASSPAQSAPKTESTPDEGAPAASSDAVELSETQGPASKRSALMDNARFLGSLTGVGIGIALAASSGASGGTYFVNGLLGAVGGGIVGGVVQPDSGQRAPLPGALQGLKENASSVGALAGAGIGLGLALSSGDVTGGAIFSKSLLGAIGGNLTGSLVGNQ